MAIDTGPALLAPTISFKDAPDEDIVEGEAGKSVQVMQIGVARETVEEMRRHAKAGGALAVGFGKHIVRSIRGLHPLRDAARLITSPCSPYVMAALRTHFASSLRVFEANFITRPGSAAGSAFKTWDSRGS